LLGGKINIYEKNRKLKIRPRGGEKRSLAGTGKLFKERSVRKLVYLFERFHRKLNNVRKSTELGED